MKIAIFSTLCAFGVAAEAPCSEGRAVRIVGGDLATEYEFPFMVSLRASDGKHECGGSLIAPNWVLTAAHCVDRKSVGMKVKLGLHNVNANDGCVETFKVVEVHSHEGYKASHMRHDIALLKLNGWSSYPLINLNTATALEQAGDTLTVAGWGALQNNGGMAKNLQKVDLTLVDQAKCDRQWDGEITDKMICAAEPAGGKDSCQGDSGGPLFTKQGGNFTQVGLVSYGGACAKQGQSGVYTRVSSYRQWIQGKMEQGTGFGTGSGDARFGDFGERNGNVRERRFGFGSGSGSFGFGSGSGSFGFGSGSGSFMNDDALSTLIEELSVLAGTGADDLRKDLTKQIEDLRERSNFGFESGSGGASDIEDDVRRLVEDLSARDGDEPEDKGSDLFEAGDVVPWDVED